MHFQFKYSFCALLTLKCISTSILLLLSRAHGTWPVVLVVSLVSVTVWAVSATLVTLAQGSAAASLALLEGHVMHATFPLMAFPMRDAQVCLMTFSFT